MSYGIFATDTSIHVIPCECNGDIKEPHIIDELCPCCPEIEQDGKDEKFLVIHNDEN